MQKGALSINAMNLSGIMLIFQKMAFYFFGSLDLAIGISSALSSTDLANSNSSHVL